MTAKKAQPGALHTAFAELHTVDLIATLGALQVIPENQQCAVRLEAATILASRLKPQTGNLVDSVNFRALLNSAKDLNALIPMEDTPENLFTENIVFQGGNYLVYPGISETGGYILQ